MTVAVADDRRAVQQTTPAPGKIRQPAETPGADRRAPSPSDSGSDTTEAGDAANPIQRTPDAVAMAKDGASVPAPARPPASTPPQVQAGNANIGGASNPSAAVARWPTNDATSPPIHSNAGGIASEPASGVPTPMIANDGGAKKPKPHPAGGSTPPHSPNSALDRPSSGDPSDEDVVGEERVPRGAEGCRGVDAVQNVPRVAPGVVNNDDNSDGVSSGDDERLGLTTTTTVHQKLSENSSNPILKPTTAVMAKKPSPPLSEADERARAACVACFRSTDDAGRLRELHAMGQRELQETFRTAFRRTTTSNNNQWLRRRIAGCMGIEGSAVAGAGPAGHARRAAAAAAAAAQVAAGGGQTGALGSIGGSLIDATGVRKSSRAAKPKILDFLPSAVCAQVAAEAPGESAIGRRVRVFWPESNAFYAAKVVGFNAKNGQHAVRYDVDGAGATPREVLLAAERIEWIRPGDDEAAMSVRAPATAAGGGALKSKYTAPATTADARGTAGATGGSTDGRSAEKSHHRAVPPRAARSGAPKLDSYALPNPGKPAKVVSLLAPNWPQPQTHVWGRVKGHGWWPGVVVRANSAEAAQAGPITASDAHSWRHVKFFDNTAAAVHRHDLVPFGEYVSVLANAKKSATYSRALSSARASYEKGVRKGSEDGFDGVCTRESLGLCGSDGAANSGHGQAGRGQQSRHEPKRSSTGRGKSFDLNADLDAPVGIGAGPVAGLLRGFGSDGGRLDASNGNLAVDGSNPLGAAGLGEKRPLELVFDDDAVDGSLSGFVPPVGVGDYPTSAGHTTHVQGGGHHKRHKGSAADREGPGHGHANRKLAAVGPDGKPFKRSHKKGQGIKARLAAEAAGLPWPPPKPEGHRARNERAHHVVHGGSYRVTAGAGVKHGRNIKQADSTSPDADPARPGSSPVTTLDLGPDDQLGALSRKLDALQTRVVPLAIAASQHLRRRLQAAETRSAHSGGEAVAVHPTAMMTERERDVLLEEMRTLQRLLTMARPGGGDARLLPPHGLRHQRGVHHQQGVHRGVAAQFHSDLGGMDAVGAGANQGVSVPNLGGEATGFGTLGPMAQMGLNDVELIDADVVGVGNDMDLVPNNESIGGLFGMVDTGGMVPMGSTMVDARMVDEEEDEDGGMLVDGDDMVGEDDALGAMLGREIAREEGARGGDRAGDDGDGDGPMDDAGGPPVAVAVAVDGDGAARTIGGSDDPAVVAVMPLESPMANGAKKSKSLLRDGDQTDDEDEEDDEDLSTGVAA